MSNGPVQPPPPAGAAPRIPTPPSGAAKRGKRAKQAGGARTLLWIGAFAVGIGLGVTAYQWAPEVDHYFDYWVALVLS